MYFPNDDNINEAFEIEGIEMFSDNELAVFNRWGAEICRQRNYANQWNAAQLTDGLYYYHLNLTQVKERFNVWVLVVR